MLNLVLPAGRQVSIFLTKILKRVQDDKEINIFLQLLWTTVFLKRTTFAAFTPHN
jgi:hypothetical protein